VVFKQAEITYLACLVYAKIMDFVTTSHIYIYIYIYIYILPFMFVCLFVCLEAGCDDLNEMTPLRSRI
jgi:hypothetical protein